MDFVLSLLLRTTSWLMRVFVKHKKWKLVASILEFRKKKLATVLRQKIKNNEQSTVKNR
jgi:hypothetical protein